MVSTRARKSSLTASTAQKTSPHAGNSTIYNIYLLGRIPFTLEAPLWCVLGNVIYYTQHGPLHPTTLLLSTGLVLLTNVSINYANEYFDYEADSIVAERADSSASHGGSKMLIDGTFGRWVALYCAAAVQAFILICIGVSRQLEGAGSSLQGTVLWFGLLAMGAAQQYVGPPLRLHYNGGGEVVSSLEIAPGPVLYGFLSQGTHAARRGLTVREAWASTSGTLVVFLAWTLAYELARIFMMHAADITEDRVARKHTLVSVLGFGRTKALYRFTSALAVLLGWNLVLRDGRAGYLMAVVALYSLPIAYRVDAALETLAVCEREGRKVETAGFASVPPLVSLQTMLTPVVLMVVMAVKGDCLA
ncbi:protein of unknown function [Taphrina deformans PYCC 5710]|uniref:Prenyltransferase n=1 Tax=Taphrina deformans (strain PYCC 5710 / ATCC 11124 / CBS 356.35 / IMI 108563 / JCM 9778 / NBRC 8474) TaxID=1097556 RepID=R4XC33_TAPDE|nr:protein of unknown function [Taphrina deformans PYCC 5710]|eukprot:CCG83437.1 protein of unknown function [Taphrina deformans PYCC 5710]